MFKIRLHILDVPVTSSLRVNILLVDILHGMQEQVTSSTPSLPSFLPSPSLTCCAILPISFGGKGPHLRRRLVAHPLHQKVS